MNQSLELFPEKDFEQKTMTVKEISESIDVPIRTIHNSIDRILPGIKQNGITTKLTQTQVSLVSIDLKRSHNVDLASTRKMANTEIEENQIIVNAMQILNRRKIELEEQILIMKPKAEFYDRVTDTTDTIDIAAASQLLGIGRNNLFSILRDRKIFKEYPNQLKNTPYQEYIDRGYFKIIETETKGGLKLKTLVYQKGLDFIRKILDKNS